MQARVDGQLLWQEKERELKEKDALLSQKDNVISQKDAELAAYKAKYGELI